MNHFARRLLETEGEPTPPPANGAEHQAAPEAPAAAPQQRGGAFNVETEMAALNYVRSLFPPDKMQQMSANRRRNLSNALKHVAAELELEDGRSGV